MFCWKEMSVDEVFDLDAGRLKSTSLPA